MNSLIITLCILITAKTESQQIRSREDVLPTVDPRFTVNKGGGFGGGGGGGGGGFGGRTESFQQQLSMPLYNSNYNTDTSIQPKEWGYFNNAGTDQKMLGSYNYIDDKGNIFQVSYVANENGFQLRAEKKADIRAYVPPLIKKALQYIAEHSEGNGK